MFDRVAYKIKAKEVYRRFTGNALVAGLVLWFVGASSGSSNAEVQMRAGTPEGVYNPDYVETVRTALNPVLVLRWLPIAAGALIVIAIVVAIILIPASEMARRYLRRLSEGDENPDWLEIIKSKQYFRLMLILVLQNLGIIIGFVFLIFPGIYLAYGWRYVGQVAVDHPEYSIGQVFSASMDLTKGNKLNLFVMDLSFFGWNLLVGLLAGLTFGILGIVGSIVLSPYVNLTDMIAYDDLKRQAYGEYERDDTIIIDID